MINLEILQTEYAFYVTSEGDSPEEILFNPQDAVDSGCQFIDAFYKDGQKAHSWEKKLMTDMKTEYYDDDF